MANFRHSLRVLRPLFWWLILVLALFTIRTHQRMMEKTRLRFSVTMHGQPINANVMFDGRAASGGQKVSLGFHKFMVTHPKAESFSKDLFVWYGKHDFGDIDLKRAVGTLNVEVYPPASLITIHGPEFKLTLADSTGTNIVVPTDEYVVEAKYALFEEQNTTVVLANSPSTVRIAPRLGAVTMESDPTGATVFGEKGRTLGTTPLTLPMLRSGLWKFTLEKDEYESATATLNVGIGETNYFQTNLVNHAYAIAMWAAKNYFTAGRYDNAVEAANEALKNKADDLTATFLLRDATGLSHLAQAKMSAERKEFPAAITELNTALQFIPDNIEIKQLLSGYTKQSKAELAERRAQEKIRELHASFNVLVRGFEDSAQFAEHELVTTNAISAVATTIKEAFSGGKPSFRVVRFEQPRPDIFALQARQILIMGYRDCFLVGENIRENETRILFKVVEYDHLPVLSLLGGIFTAKVTQEHDAAHTAQFEQQIREGAPMVEERIRHTIAQ